MVAVKPGLLTMRPTGGHSPVYADRQDWTIFDDG
jgi:hypothetical protein